MINVKKGASHSLLQSDKVGKIKSGQTGIEAGMVITFDNNEEISKGGVSSGNALYAFAINAQGDGDVISSGKIAGYLLDGSSVIETDQTAEAVTSVNYPIGSTVYPVASTGKVTNANTINKPLGTVEGIRSLPGLVVVNGTKIPGTIACLAIKLSA